MLKKMDILEIPMHIRSASEVAQNKATKKTCCRRIPILKTNAFCAPIATINESPRKKPVKNAENIKLTSVF